MNGFALQAVINFVTEMIGEGKHPESICEELLGYCLAPVCQMGGLGGDNMSIIIVCFLHGKPYENLVERCKKIHTEKKASTKLSEPAFAGLDRFTADGPFADLSVLKAADDVHAGDSTSSSSPSSSPISTDEKYEAMLTDATGSETAEKTQEKAADQPEASKEWSPAAAAAASSEAESSPSQAASGTPSEAAVEASPSAAEASTESSVSNGE